MRKILLVLVIMATALIADNNLKPFVIQKDYTINYDNNTTCLVRHLKLYKAPRWVAMVKAKNGKRVYFSSPKSMFEFYHRPGKWYDVGIKKEDDFDIIAVTDYETQKPIDAKSAYYVYGSNKTSPAGDDLPAFSTKKQAQDFSDKNNGKRVLKFSEVKDALIGLLNGKI